MNGCREWPLGTDTIAKTVTLNLQTVIDWAHQHPTALTLILFLVSCAISIYGREVRGFLHNWPRTSKAIDTVSYRMAQHDLAEIESLHKNTYNVLLYSLSLFVAGSKRIVIVVGILYTLSAVAKSPLSYDFRNRTRTWNVYGTN